MRISDWSSDVCSSDLTNLVALLHEQTTTVFHMTDFTLRAAKLRLERGTLAQDDPGFRAELTAMRASLAYLRALFVIGPDGFPQHDTHYPDTPRFTLADRPSLRSRKTVGQGKSVYVMLYLVGDRTFTKK